MPFFRELNPQVAGRSFGGHSRIGTRARPVWATSSIEDAADRSPVELKALGAHVDLCNGSRERMFGIRCAADSLYGFLAPRLVTTLVAVAIVFGVISLVV